MKEYLAKRALYPGLIPNTPSSNLGICIVIPCLGEATLFESLESLSRCSTVNCGVEVLVILNDGVQHHWRWKASNMDQMFAAQRWKSNINSSLKFHFLVFSNLPKKDAGVGLARKIGMDEAVRRFKQAGNPAGIIVCFDADTLCQPNYLNAIFEGFKPADRIAASIHYEHPIEGTRYSEEVYKAIVDYELHLRYYVEAQRWAGFPYATQTIGSAMAVRSTAYEQQGGMNKRKAGEDFYFLHKFSDLKGFFELKDTTVIPSPRISHRVPFGTGRAVAQALQSGQQKTYNPLAFCYLKSFFQAAEQLFDSSLEEQGENWSGLLWAYLDQHQGRQKIAEIRANASSAKTFKKRFFRWFGAFEIMKFMHFTRDQGLGLWDVPDAARWLALKHDRSLKADTSKDLLIHYRKAVKAEPSAV